MYCIQYFYTDIQVPLPVKYQGVYFVSQWEDDLGKCSYLLMVATVVLYYESNIFLRTLVADFNN